MTASYKYFQMVKFLLLRDSEVFPFERAEIELERYNVRIVFDAIPGGNIIVKMLLNKYSKGVPTLSWCWT